MRLKFKLLVTAVAVLAMLIVAQRHPAAATLTLDGDLEPMPQQAIKKATKASRRQSSKVKTGVQTERNLWLFAKEYFDDLGGVAIDEAGTPEDGGAHSAEVSIDQSSSDLPRF